MGLNPFGWHLTFETDPCKTILKCEIETIKKSPAAKKQQDFLYLIKQPQDLSLDFSSKYKR
ncbi:hypothetical protein BBI11_15850 [Planococcus maritimus]|nr:hypothetical protein BBI11_15850 [Planococcus maritimus]